jgi:hypothetical protein
VGGKAWKIHDEVAWKVTAGKVFLGDAAARRGRRLGPTGRATGTSPAAAT